MYLVQGTVHEAFLASAQRYPANDFLCVEGATATRYGIDARSFSYADAAREVESLRVRYSAAGLGAGQRVGLMLENRPAFFFHWLALNGLGASVVPISREWRSAELEYLAGHSEIRAAVVPGERVEDLRRAGLEAGRSLGVTTPDLALLPECGASDAGGSGAGSTARAGGMPGADGTAVGKPGRYNPRPRMPRILLTQAIHPQAERQLATTAATGTHENPL